MSTKHKYHLIFIAIFTIALTLGFTTTAMAQSATTAPNPGGPITVDGNYADWDLDADFYAEMLRASGNPTVPKVVEAIAYVRVDYATNTMYVLIRTTAASPNIITTDMEDVFVKIDNQKPAWDFAWVNQQGDYADGWEASFPIDEGTFTFQIHTQVENEGPQTAGTGRVTIEIYRWDYGDLPDSYGTYETSNGPRHSAGTLRLGLQVDGESDGQPGTNPILDDLNGRNDEDGVITIGNWRYGTPTIQYTVNGCTGTCYLNAWIDWGHYVEDEDDEPGEGSWQPDGSFDPEDELFINREVSGIDTITFSIPEGVGFAATFNTRFRLCDTVNGCATPLALSADDAPAGEVEDYQWSFSPNAVTLNSFSASPPQNPTILYLLVGSVATILILGAATLIQKRRI